MRGSRPDNRTKPRRCDSEFTAVEFDSTLGYAGRSPPRVPDFESMERCDVCGSVCKKCEKKIPGDGEMQGVCKEILRDSVTTLR